MNSENSNAPLVLITEIKLVRNDAVGFKTSCIEEGVPNAFFYVFFMPYWPGVSSLERYVPCLTMFLF